MIEIIEEQLLIRDTKNIEIVLDWIKKYYLLDESVKATYPLFSIDGIEFFYFEQSDRQDGEFEVNGNTLRFDDLIEAGLDEYIKKSFDNIDEVYQTDVNYAFEVIYKVDVIENFIKTLEKRK